MRGSRLVTTERLVCLFAPGTEPLVDRLRAIAESRGLGFESSEVGESLPAATLNSRDTLGVVVGGDGTFLRAVTEFGSHEIPVVGINAGTLGFLTRVPPSNLEPALDDVLAGDADVTEQLRCRVTGGGLDAVSINEVAFEPPEEDPGTVPDCSLAVFVEDEFVGRYEGGGLSINTPTGSTALALSADGPVHFGPDNGTLQLTPLHPGSVATRPLVVGESRQIQVVATTPVKVNVDGERPSRRVEAGTRFTVTGADLPALVVRTRYDRSFMAALADNLGWSPREPDQTSYEPAITRGSGGEPENRHEQARDVAREAVRVAGAPVRDIFDRVEETESGALRDELVDRALSDSERIITSILTNAFPDERIVSEGVVVHEGSGRNGWLVDPLDGTGNFAHGSPNYTISVALLSRDGDPVVGVVYSPETDEVFHAVRDGPAVRTGRPIRPTGRDRLDESMLLSGYDPTGDFLEQFYQQARGVRRLGCASLHLCYVAAGSADGHWEYDTDPWDVAAGLCLLEAAGGRATDARGRPYELQVDDTKKRTPLLTSNGPLHESLLDGFVSRSSTRDI